MMYAVEETDERVVGYPPDLVTRFRWRADRRCRKLNARRLVPFYRWEVVEGLTGRWMVVAMQNVAGPPMVVPEAPWEGVRDG